MRWILRIIMLGVALVALSLALLFLVPTERIANIVGDQFEAATGRNLDISGEIRPSLWPVIGVRASGIEIGNPDWVEEGPMLVADRLRVGVDLMALFGGEIRVQRFELARPRIILVQGADGRNSWDFSAEEAAAAAEEAADPGTSETDLSGYSLDLAEISDGSLLFVDDATGMITDITGIDLTLRLPSTEGLASASGGASMNGAELDFEAGIDGIAQLLRGEIRDVTASADWSGGEAEFAGRVGLSPLGVDGNVSFEASDLGPLMALAGQSAPELPRGLGRDRLAASGEFTLASEGTMHLRNADLSFDDNALSGDIDILPGPDRPLIRAALSGGALDLSGLSEGGSDAGSGGDSASTGWPTDNIDVSGLFAADLEAALALGGLDLGLANLGQVDIRANLENGRAVVDLRQVAAYGGAISGQYIVNGRGGLSMRADLDFAGVELAPLLTEFADFERLEGTGNASIDLLMVGNNVNALMNSLSGSAAVEFGQGAILGLDIGGMIRNLDTSYQGEGQRTVYDQISASFAVEDGVARGDDLLLSAPFGELTGEGSIGLGQQVMDYRVVPRVVTGSGDGLRVPLTISGPWSDLSYNLDLAALAEQELGEELEALEDQAEEQLRDRAEEILGLEEIDPDASAGDVLRDAVENSVSDALGLGGNDGGDGDTASEEELTPEELLRQEAENQLLRLLGGDN